MLGGEGFVHVCYCNLVCVILNITGTSTGRMICNFLENREK